MYPDFLVGAEGGEDVAVKRGALHINNASPENDFIS